MLILARGIDQKIIISPKDANYEIIVQVLAIEKGQVKIGISAPKDVAVHREEVDQRIKREKQAKEGERGHGEI